MLLSLFGINFLSAQQTSYHTQLLPKAYKAATIDVAAVDIDFAPNLQHLEAPDGNSYQAYLNQVKAQIEQRYPRKQSNRPTSRANAPEPVIGRSLAGNNRNWGVPLDTHAGISNGGQVVSVINTGLLIQDSAGNVQQDISLDAFWSPLNIPGNIFDPKIHYDPDLDRWIMCIMHRDATRSTGFHFAFSQTNDATGNWNLYSYDGNPFNNNTWADYPMLTISKDEVFLTVNSIRNGEPWETGFEETLIYQINKFNGYAGDSLETRIWSGVKFGLLTLRNLCPIKGGDGNSGPNTFFLSNRNFDVANSAIFVVEVTDTLDAPGVTLNVDLRVSDREYRLPPNARQPTSSRLATNDARILDGFIFNNRIQFVATTLDTTNGSPAIFHGLIEDAGGSKILTAHIIHNDSLDMGYPSIAFTGTSDTSYDEQDAIIFFDYSGLSDFATMGAVYSEYPGSYSDVVPVRAGEGYIDLIAGTERWGDYTVCQRRYNDPGWVWTIGTYGLANRAHAAWIGEFGRPVPAASIDPRRSEVKITAFPNPAHEVIYVEFDIPPREKLSIRLLNIEGKVIKTLYDFYPRRFGNSRFSFSTEPLANGIYMLEVKSESGLLTTKKVVVRH